MTAEQLQQIESSLEHISTQKRNFQAQLTEADSALSEIGSESTFKIIGNIMVKRSGEVTKKELQERKETLSVRINTLEKQEEKLRAKQKDIQENMMKDMKKKK